MWGDRVMRIVYTVYTIVMCSIRRLDEIVGQNESSRLKLFIKNINKHPTNHGKL
jgi:hypothetical protein